MTIASSFTFSMRAISLRISGEICSIEAIRSASSPCSSGGASRITLAARSGAGTFASTTAIVCGFSLRRNAQIWSGGERRRNSSGVASIAADRRARISAARIGPSAFSSVSRANDAPPSAR